MSAPQSTIHICSGVRLNNRYEHTIYFESRAAQQAYFAGKVVKSFSAYTFLRKSWPIKVQATMEQAQKWDYLFFTNDGSRYWYYFINDVEYINDNTVQLSLVMDVMQSYLAGEDYTLLPCFVERQHVSDDSVGKNIIEEGLDVGEYVVKETEDLPLNDLCIMILSTVDLEDPDMNVLYAKVDGCFSGAYVSACLYSMADNLGELLKELDKAGKSDCLISMWMYPKNMVQLYGDSEWTDGATTHPVAGVYPFYNEQAFEFTLADEYAPRNKKLLTYPFNFLYVTNNLGEAATYRYEKFGNYMEPVFRVTGSIGAGGGVRMYPLNYNGEQHNYEAGITLGAFPTCAWNQDVYKLWLAQNQGQHTLSMITETAKLALGVAGVFATGGALGLVGGGTAISSGLAISQHMAEVKDRSIQPPQAKGAASSSINVANDFQTLTVKKMCVSPQYAKILDSYFDMYGYKLNEVKTPNIATRENWTYVKTVGCHIDGEFCISDATEIEGIFDKGITFWKNGNNIGNYSLRNNPV